MVFPCAAAYEDERRAAEMREIENRILFGLLVWGRGGGKGSDAVDYDSSRDGGREGGDLVSWLNVN